MRQSFKDFQHQHSTPRKTRKSKRRQSTIRTDRHAWKLHKLRERQAARKKS